MVPSVLPGGEEEGTEGKKEEKGEGGEEAWDNDKLMGQCKIKENCSIP